jgi:TDG/mug DNA glycosylase family protein
LEFASVLDDGIGLTDLCNLRAGSDVTIGRDAFDIAGLTARIAKQAPIFLAFNGVKAARETLGVIDGYGPQTLRVADALTWVLPSTSGAASGSSRRAARGLDQPPCQHGRNEVGG